jgi:hypothetical protein
VTEIHLSVWRAELYGPQQEEMVSSAAEALATGVELIVDDLQDILQEEHINSVVQTARDIAVAHEKLLEKAATSEQHRAASVDERGEE